MIQYTFSRDVTPHCFCVETFRYIPLLALHQFLSLLCQVLWMPSPTSSASLSFGGTLYSTSITWLGTCSLCASVKPWTCSRRGSRSSTAESSNSRNWVGGTWRRTLKD